MKKLLFLITLSFIALFQMSCEEALQALASSTGCMLEDSSNYKDTALAPCVTECVEDADGTLQSGANCCCQPITYGCIDPLAFNYVGEEFVVVEDLPGCLDEAACNYDSEATVDDGSCWYSDENFDCEGNCITEIDECGVCGGDSSSCELHFNVTISETGSSTLFIFLDSITSLTSGDEIYFNPDNTWIEVA